jgi:hypothetical protein
VVLNSGVYKILIDADADAGLLSGQLCFWTSFSKLWGNNDRLMNFLEMVLPCQA